MKFSLPFFHNKAVETPLYLGVFLKEDEGHVYYIKRRGKGLEVVASENFTTSAGWDNLVEDLDEILYRLERKVQAAPDQTIFFVYSHLIDEDSRQIKRPFLDKIKALVKKLDLKPLGYIDTHEAVVEGLQQKEDSPLTAVLVEADASNLQLFVYKGGKVVSKDHVVRTDDIVADITPFLKHVRRGVVLPSRIILYDGGTLHSEAGKIINHSWDEDFFIQLPKVMVVEPQELQEYLLQVFYEQMSASSPAEEPVPEAAQERSKEEVMGFVIGGDVGERLEPGMADGALEVAGKAPIWAGWSRSTVAEFFMPRLRKAKALIARATGGSFPVIPVVGGALILIAILCMEFFFHKATVTLFLSSQEVEENLAITGSETPQEGALLVGTESTSLKAEGSRTTTGRKEVGKKARGEVTLHNFSDSERTFTKDSELTSENLKFILLEEVKVASSSLAADGSAKLPGKGKGSVEAGALGDEYNLASGRRFTIADLPSATYFGINDDNLTGGSKKEVRTVASADAEALEDALLKSAKEALKKKLAQMGASKKIIDALTRQEIAQFTPSAKVGEEADTVRATSNVEATYYYYDDKAFRALLAKKMEKELSKGNIIDQASMNYTITKASTKDDLINLAVEVSARAGPTVSRAEIMRDLTGARTSAVLEVVKEKYKADGLEYEVQHPLPFMRGLLPVFKRNIEMKITYKKQL